MRGSNRYVRTLEDHGHRVDVIALRSDGESSVEERPTGTIFRVMDKYQGQSTLAYAGSYLRFLLKAMLLLARRSFGNRYDVVHVHNMPNVLVFAAMVPKMFGARLLLDVHDLMTVNYMAKFDCGESDSRIQALKMEQRIAAMFADHLICADHNQQDYLADHCGVPRSKVTVLMNLPNAELFGPTPTVKEKKSGAFRIVYHGTIAHRLGIDLILRAIARIGNRIPAELWMYGAGDYLPEALALSTELGLDEKVHFSRSFFPVEKIPEIVCGMDLGIIGNRRNLACDKYMLPVKVAGICVPRRAGRGAAAGRDRPLFRRYDAALSMSRKMWNRWQTSIVALYNNPEERERQAQRGPRFLSEAQHQSASRSLPRLTDSAPGSACTRCPSITRE